MAPNLLTILNERSNSVSSNLDITNELVTEAELGEELGLSLLAP